MAFSDVSTGLAASLALHVGVAVVMLESSGSGVAGQQGELLVQVTLDESPAGESEMETRPDAEANAAVILTREAIAEPAVKRPLTSPKQNLSTGVTRHAVVPRAPHEGTTERSGILEGHGSLPISVEGPETLSIPKPTYPRAARRLGLSGRASYRVGIGADGTVTAVELVTSSGSDLLDEAGRESLQKAAFKPARANGAPVASEKTISIVFELVDQSRS
jgi:protein TonB